MPVLIVACETCSKSLPADDAFFHVGQELNFCRECYLAYLLEEAIKERQQFSEWLESTYLKRLRDMDERIKKLQAGEL